MEAKVVRWGGAFAVPLTNAEAEELGIREGETVEIVSKSERSAQSVRSTGRGCVDGLPVYTMGEMIAEMRRLGPAAEPASIEWGCDRGSEIIDDERDPY